MWDTSSSYESGLEDDEALETVSKKYSALMQSMEKIDNIAFMMVGHLEYCTHKSSIKT